MGIQLAFQGCHWIGHKILGGIDLKIMQFHQAQATQSSKQNNKQSVH